MTAESGPRVTAESGIPVTAGSAGATPPRGPEGPSPEIRRQIRGSSMLLGGRVLSMVANLAVMAVTVRSLTKTEFGHFSYALSIVSAVSGLVTLGIDQAVPRFVAVFDERRSYGELVGTLIIQVTAILGISAFAALVVVGGRGWLSGSLVRDADNLGVLMVLIALAPIQAFDDFAVALFAVYAKPSAIFFRRYLLTPVMRLVVVGLLVVADGGARFLAVGYVVTGLVGVALYAILLIRLLKERRVFALARAQGVSLPWRSVLGYSLPLMTTDVLYSVMNTSDVVLLDRYHDADAVASYRSVVPAAKLNQFVMTSFALLFVPLMARMLERHDRAGVTDLYWRTAAWIAVASFPMFALTFSLSEPITVAMFGEGYRNAGDLLALMSLGYYFNAALGFNGLTVKTAGRVAYTVGISILALAVNLGLSFLWIPAYGALGAALATLGSLVFHNIMKQLGLRAATDIPLYSSEYAAIYAYIVVGAGMLFLCTRFLGPPLGVELAIAAIVSVGVFALSRQRLSIRQIFPEVTAVPVLGRWLS